MRMDIIQKAVHKNMEVDKRLRCFLIMRAGVFIRVLLAEARNFFV
jgi:hypothetical protein